MVQISLLQEILTSFAEIHQRTSKLHSYSGRGMSGRECLGIMIRGVDLGSLVGEIIAYTASEADTVDPKRLDELARQVRCLRTDSMGQDIILYFPSVPFVDSDGEQEEKNVSQRNTVQFDGCYIGSDGSD